MLGDVAKRAVNLAVVALAAVAFFLVPFGRRTLYQHVRAVLSTPQAAELGQEIEKKAVDVKREVIAPPASANASAIASAGARGIAPHSGGH